MISRHVMVSARWIAAAFGYFALAACARSGPATPATPLAPSSRIIDFETREGTRLAFDISPDGREIVFDLLGQLWILPAAGGPARAITNSVERMSVDLDPAWSPDGDWIAFQGDEGAARVIWLVRPDGTGLRRLTDSTMSPASSPAWSADGKRLAYVTRDSIRIVDLADGTTRVLRVDSLDRGPIRTPAWSPDGSRIAFAFGVGRIMEVSSDGGRPTAISATALRASSPTYSPDAARLAFFVDSVGVRQLWIQEKTDTVARQLAPQRDLTNLRVRWSPAGDTLLYSAGGRLWRRALSAPTPEEIPFTARVRFARREPLLRDVTFPKPGAEMRARGFLGLALSPDGERAAMIALGRLWLIKTADGAARDVAPVPFTANGLAWSPDGRHVAWSAGAGGSEDIWVTNVESGATRRVISLSGREERASWSPDGQWIAFVHWPKAMCDTPPSRYDDECGLLRLRAVRVGASTVERLDDTRLLATPGVSSWTFTVFGEGQEIPQWSSRSDGVYYSTGGQISFAPLDGTSRPVGRIPAPSTFVHVRADTSVVFVRGNQLWSVRSPGEPEVLLSPDPALYPSFARDGRILYLSSDGLRVRLPDGETRSLGWPLSFRIPRQDGGLLIRGARVIDGTGAEPKTRDILVRDGRIAALADSGSLTAARGTRVISAEGRVVIPGLVDLHGHLWDDAVLPASLAHGVTTMREMGGPAARVAGMRDAITAGAAFGPRLVAGGFQFNPGGSNLSAVVLQSPADSAASARGLALLTALGGEYAKMRLATNQQQGAAFVRAARDRGMRVSGHCAHTLPLIAAGMSAKEHLSASCSDRSDGLWYDDMAQLFREAGMPVVVTSAAFATVPRVQRDTSLLRGDAAPFVTPFLRWWALRLAPTSGAVYGRLAQISRAAAAALRGKVAVIPASDDPTMADALHWELEEMVAAGWSPLQTIRAVTHDAAVALGAEREIGTIGVGKLADLLILDADPLADIRNTRRILHVIQGGRVVDRAAILRSR